MRFLCKFKINHPGYKLALIIAGFLVFVLFLNTLGFSESVFILQPNLKTVKFKTIAASNTVVTKPTCPAGWIPSIFVTPAVISGYSSAAGNTLNNIAMAQAYAQDNGNGTWSALLQVKDHAGNLLLPTDNSTRGRLLIETMCCPAGGDCI